MNSDKRVVEYGIEGASILPMATVAALAGVAIVPTGPRRKLSKPGKERGIVRGFGSRQQQRTTTGDRRAARKAERKRRGR